MQYIYIYIIMKYVDTILLNYQYIIYRSHLPRHLSTGSFSYSACMRSDDRKGATPANTRRWPNVG